MEKIIIRTDGSCVNNGIDEKEKSAGCAFVVYKFDTGEEITRKAFKLEPSFETPFTENRCEAMAILKAVLWLKENSQYEARIESDSKTIVDGIIGLARRRANRDIWNLLESAIPDVADRISGFKLIPRTSNVEADKAAKQAALAICVFQE